jgi:inosine-uridine nucleoside N-ribohydrolase
VFEGAASPRDRAARTAATDALASQLRTRQLTYVALGPLTNLAAFLQLHPQLARKIERVIIVGGQSPDRPPRFGPNRSHRIHDANVFKDPASAALVLQAGIPITLAAIDTASQLALTRDDLEQLRDGGPVGRFLYRKTRVWLWFWTKYVREPGGLVFDALAILPAIEPKLLKTEPRFAKVDEAGNLIAFRSRSRTRTRCSSAPVCILTRSNCSCADCVKRTRRNCRGSCQLPQFLMFSACLRRRASGS